MKEKEDEKEKKIWASQRNQGSEWHFLMTVTSVFVFRFWS